MNKLNILAATLIFLTTPLESIGIIEGFSVTKLTVAFFIFTSFLNLKNLKYSITSFIILVMMYIGWGCLSFFWAIDEINTLGFYMFLIPTIIMVILLEWGINEERYVYWLLGGYCIGSLILTVTVFLYSKSIYSEARYGDQMRVSVFNQDQNELAFLLNMGVVFFLFLANTLPWTRKKLFYLPILAVVPAVLMTGSRTGFIVLLLIGFVYFVTYGKKNLSALFIIIPAAILLACFLVPEDIFNRLFETKQQIQDGNFTGRGYIWKSAFQSFAEEGAYLQGSGWGNFSELTSKHTGLHNAPHNSYIGTLVELGIIGLFIFLTLLFYIIKKNILLCRLLNSYYPILLIFPLCVTMLTLGTITRRWMFLFGFIIIKLVELKKVKTFR